MSEVGEDNESGGGEKDGKSTTCSTVSGPAAGSQCVFPFTLGEQTFTECAEWTYSGENQGKLWCSTKQEEIRIVINSISLFLSCIGLTATATILTRLEIMDSALLTVNQLT